MDAGRTPFGPGPLPGDGSQPTPAAPAEDRVLFLEDQLRSRQEALAHLGHDLRTPLNSIIGFSELMLTGIGGTLNPKHKEFVEAVHRNGHLMLGLINDLLDWSMVDGGRATLRTEAVDLGRLATDIRSCTEPVVAEAGLAVTWPDPAALAGQTFRMDPKRMMQVLLNLIDNARKFTPRGGFLAVAIAPEAARLVLTVQDSGPGIQRSEADRIFRPYWTRSPLPTKGGQERILGASGSGLGLSIVQAVVRLHGGTVQVDRGSLGGACFQVILPRT
jgi:signal transduction histidine kinase